MNKNNNQYFLTLKNISKSYPGIRALDKISIKIKKGEICGLCGENGSGKSTMVKIISGVLRQDDGLIIIKNEIIRHMQAIDAMRYGIHVVYQDLSLFPNLTVAENIYIEELIKGNNFFMNWKNIEKRAREALGKINVKINPNSYVKDIAIANKMLVEIAKSITKNAELIIMDEPTSSLTKKEVSILFEVIRNLKKRGMSILFVSHKLDEMLDISDVITVLRDGKFIGRFDSSRLKIKNLVYLMTGQKTKDNSDKSKHIFNEKRKEALLEIKNLSKRRNYKNINLKVHKGEILGITGLLGSGRTELALSIYGMNKPDLGDFYLEGKKVKILSNRDATKLGIQYLPDDRLAKGLILKHSVEKNIVINILNNILNKLMLISNKKIKKIANYWIDRLDIRCPSSDSEIQNLSGGNQQKAVLAKCLATNPKILILDSPTAGIDVGAKKVVHSIFKNLAKKGLGIILISDEIQEIVDNCARVIIMMKGKITKELSGNISEDIINDYINYTNNNHNNYVNN